MRRSSTAVTCFTRICRPVFPADDGRPGGLVVLDDYWWPGSHGGSLFRTNLGWRPHAFVKRHPGRLHVLRLPDPRWSRDSRCLTPFCRKHDDRRTSIGSAARGPVALSDMATALRRCPLSGAKRKTYPRSELFRFGPHSGSRETLSLKFRVSLQRYRQVFFEVYCHDGESFMRASAARRSGLGIACDFTSPHAHSLGVSMSCTGLPAALTAAASRGSGAGSRASRRCRR